MATEVPRFASDEDAERFLDQDLSGLDPAQFKPARFELHSKDARLTMRLPAALLSRVKARAAEAGVPYQRWVRDALAKAV